MGSSRMIAKRIRGVFMAHLCSKCGFPLISVVQIQSESQKTYTFSQSKASEIASQTAEQAIEDEIHRIEACWSSRTILIGKIKKSSMISPGYFCDSSFTGHETRCPYCGNLEPWKGTSSNGLAMDQLTDANFPIVFKDVNDAEGWAKDRVRDIIQAINIQRENADVVASAISRTVQIKQDLDRYLELSLTIPEKSQLIQLKEKLKELEKRKSQLGMLDFKGKKNVSSVIKVTKLKIADLSKLIAVQDAPLLERIQSDRQELLYAQAIAFGCTNDLISLRNGNSFSYRYTANDIPIELTTAPLYEEGENIAQSVQESVNSTTEHSYAPLFCRKCGYKLLPDSTFCTKCGSRV